MELADIRREYTKGGLRRKDLAADPIDQFNLWLQQAVEAGLTDPTAMTVATVDENGMPFQRIVLLKNVDKNPTKKINCLYILFVDFKLLFNVILKFRACKYTTYFYLNVYFTVIYKKNTTFKYKVVLINLLKF